MLNNLHMRSGRRSLFQTSGHQVWAARRPDADGVHSWESSGFERLVPRSMVEWNMAGVDGCE